MCFRARAGVNTEKSLSKPVLSVQPQGIDTFPKVPKRSLLRNQYKHIFSSHCHFHIRRDMLEALSTRKNIEHAILTHMLHNKHTRFRAPEASHDSLIYQHDTSDTLSPISLSETTKSPSKPGLRALMSGGPTNHCTKRISAGGGGFPDGILFTLLPVPYLVILITRMEPATP